MLPAIPAAAAVQLFKETENHFEMWMRMVLLKLHLFDCLLYSGSKTHLHFYEVKCPSCRMPDVGWVVDGCFSPLHLHVCFNMDCVCVCVLFVLRCSFIWNDGWVQEGGCDYDDLLPYQGELNKLLLHRHLQR